MRSVVPISSTKPRLPRHSAAEGGFSQVGRKLHLAPKTVESNYYDAKDNWKTRKGRRDYIAWLNKREKIWEAYQSKLENRSPVPREYFLVDIKNLDNLGEDESLKLIGTRYDESGEIYIVPLLPGEAESFEKEAWELMDELSGKADYDHWRKQRNAGLLRVQVNSGRPS